MGPNAEHPSSTAAGRAWVERTRNAWLATRARLRAAAGPDPERGDVPGWVLVTLMTAGLVTALWLLAGPLLEGLFSDAVTSVTGG